MEGVKNPGQLKYYIALGAPPTRIPINGNEPFMRPEVGFNPSWFRAHCGIDFSEKWHFNLDYRLQCHERMVHEIKTRFPGRPIGQADQNKEAPDLLTGLFGAYPVPAILGRSLHYHKDKWPTLDGSLLDNNEMSSFRQANLDTNPIFVEIMRQMDQIETLVGPIRGVLNWQGVLNTAFNLRGQEIFADMVLCPDLADRLFGGITETMIEFGKRIYKRQAESGVYYDFGNVSNCTVNMAGPLIYERHIFPHDMRIRQAFSGFAVHNCAWTVDPYMDIYARIPNLGYIDMGFESDFLKARRIFSKTRRNVLYRTIDLMNRSDQQIRADFQRIARELAPCDVGLPDIEADVPDDRIKFAMDLCAELNDAAS